MGLRIRGQQSDQHIAPFLLIKPQFEEDKEGNVNHKSLGLKIKCERRNMDAHKARKSPSVPVIMDFYYRIQGIKSLHPYERAHLLVLNTNSLKI